MINLKRKADDLAKLSNSERLIAISNELDALEVNYIITASKEGVKNIIVPTSSGEEPKVIIGVHYDAPITNPKENESTAACSALLAIIGKLRDSNYPIEYVFFDKKELGALGSKAYLNMVDVNSAELFIDLTHVGYGSNIGVDTHNYNLPIIKESFLLPKMIGRHRVYRLFGSPFSDSYSFVNKCPTVTVMALKDENMEVIDNRVAEYLYNIKDSVDVNEGTILSVIVYILDVIKLLNK